MKALSKPLSSPSRTEKFPPPLMRFLRSNVGSRSRGRSRSSPMFYLRSKKSLPAGVTETTQEPSSPKVTCIGQVRVRRSAKSKPKKSGGAAVKRRRRWWLKKTLFCGKTSSGFISRKKPFRRFFCKCGLFFRSGYCKKVDATEDSFRVYSNQKSEKNEKGENRNSCSSDGESDYRVKCENLGIRSQENKRDFLESCSSSNSPPKNALMLTRCRSAPYRSSSLGGRFWGSTLGEEEKEEEEEEGNKVVKDEKSENSRCEDVEGDRRSSEEIISSKESENSANKIQELKTIGGGAVHPLILTRCKSEPARTGERLNAEAILLRQTRLDVVQPRSQQNS